MNTIKLNQDVKIQFSVYEKWRIEQVREGLNNKLFDVEETKSGDNTQFIVGLCFTPFELKRFLEAAFPNIK